MTDSETRRRLSQLEDRIRDDLAAATRRQWATASVLGVLCLFALIYMSWLYRQVSQVDAESVTALVAGALQEQLPDVKRTLAQRGRQAAPQVIDHVNQIVIDSPAKVRVLFEDRLDHELEVVVTRFEDTLSREIDRMLDAEIAAVKKLHGDKPEAEQLELLLEHTRRKNREQLEVKTDELYADYSREMTRLNDYFLTLQGAENLSEEQRIHKEILEAWAALVPRHRDKLPLPAQDE